MSRSKRTLMRHRDTPGGGRMSWSVNPFWRSVAASGGRFQTPLSAGQFWLIPAGYSFERLLLALSTHALFVNTSEPSVPGSVFQVEASRRIVWGRESMARRAHLTSLARKRCRPCHKGTVAFWNCPNPRDMDGNGPHRVSCNSKKICQSSA